ncbi:hypothetical protein [Xanthomonas translucens]|uniref:hypothetical protein n=1 Tax=Xanthomonas campestris pv. translucens TaxID=343 RepID=UPI0019D708D2|nr:hypothetical protein [Xanthomonas translucens]QSQ62202.1 hypothetical protein ISN38_19740 [Xanthomonas translucens pv. undulosa]
MSIGYDMTANPHDGNEKSMGLRELGIYTNPDGKELWLNVLPKIEGKHPTTDDGQRTRWLRIDTITEVMAELAIDSAVIDERQYMMTVVADGKAFHPTIKLLDGNEAGMAEFTLIDMIGRALMVLKR